MSVPTTQEEVESSSSSSQMCRRFTFSEIQIATENLDESLVIGSGGFGKVYKGTITNGENTLTAAIKRLDSMSNQGASEFWAEVNMLSNLRHCHLVSLIGYCNDGHEMILVYEYMSHGSLEDHLHKRQTPLSWVQRLTICIGAARGLDYLHTGTGIKHGVVHRDVKTTNILLHNTWEAKISDFGLSKICPRNQKSTYVNTIVKGTFGYLDPDYFYTGKLTRKSDVYAFGVVLFEVLCGKQAVDSSIDEDQWALAIWAQDSIKEGRLKQIVDADIRVVISPKCLKLFAHLAKRCLHKHLKQRPTMAEVVVYLEVILALQEKANNTLQAIGMQFFAKKALTVIFPSIGKNSSSVSKNSSSVGKNYFFGVYDSLLELHINALLGENQTLFRFDLHTLIVATEDFSEANTIEYDPRTRCLYKGKLQNGQGITVWKMAICSMTMKYKFTELILVKLEHENLPKLLGYCLEGDILCYVCDFVPHTSLDRMIFDPWCSPLLNWDGRYKIVLGVSRALLYLHKHAPVQIVHCDVKPSNIHLDESFNPKLLGLFSAKVIKKNTEIKKNASDYRICGSDGYMPREYAVHGHLSTKVDVHGLGVMLLETITGDNMIRLGLNNVKENWVAGTFSDTIDPRINVDSSSMMSFIDIGFLCLQEVEHRPTMEEVVGMLLSGSSPTILVSQMRARMSAPYATDDYTDSDDCTDSDDYTDAEDHLSCVVVDQVKECISELCLR